MKTEDGNIIHRCLNGEPEAFGLLVDKYKSGIYAFVYAKIGDFHYSQDISQEVFIQAYRDLPGLRNWESFVFWLYRIASTHCKRWFRSRDRRPDPEFIEDQKPKTLEDYFIETYREDEENESLQDALDSLPDNYREVLLLHYFGGMTSNEIARALGISSSAILQRLSRGRIQLKEVIMDMETLEEKKLNPNFTFHIVELVKRINIKPAMPAKELPWSLSIATGIIITILSLGQYFQLFSSNNSPVSFSSEKVSLLSMGEIPVDALNYNTSFISSSQENDNNISGMNEETGYTDNEESNNTFIDPNTGMTFTKTYSDDKLNLLSHNRGLVISPDGRFLFDLNNHVIPLRSDEEPFDLIDENLSRMNYGSWSPDMSKFAFITYERGDLFVLTISPETGRPNGSPIKLAESVRDENVRRGDFPPCWSPDSKYIAFSWWKDGDFNIWTVSAKDGEPKQITKSTLWERFPVWTPDGKNIIFSRSLDNVHNIWDVWSFSLDGGNEEKILDNAIAWGFSPDGRWLAFHRDGVEGVGLLRLDDKREFNIAPSKTVVGEFSYGPKVILAPRENKLLFYNSGFEYRSTLGFVMVYGGPSVELGKELRLDSYMQAWSPDGKFILTIDTDTNDLWILPTNGKAPKRLKVETDPKLLRYPFLPFSPDLKKLAFIAEDKSLWVVTMSIEERRLTGPAIKVGEEIKDRAYLVGWSPDSTKLAFSSVKGGNADVWIATVDGSELKQLTDDQENEGVAGTTLSGCWSPDGNMIAYAKGKDVWVMFASGEEQRELVKDACEQIWSPDGKEIAFLKRDSSSISAIELETGRTREIIDLNQDLVVSDKPSHAWGLTWSPDGKRISFFTVENYDAHFWIVPAEGGKAKELAKDDPGKWFQYWSPEGQKLSFNSDKDVWVSKGAIWGINVDEYFGEQ